MSTQFLLQLCAWHSLTADVERDPVIQQFHRDAVTALHAVIETLEGQRTSGTDITPGTRRRDA